jgi:protein O-mannosyl-transferase
MSEQSTVPASVMTMHSNSTRRSWLLALALVLVTVVAYLPALHNGFIWDDNYYVTANPTIKSLDGLRQIWTQLGVRVQQYYPVSFTGLWIEYHLWGLQPFGYHLVNILLHALNAILLWRVLRRLDVPGAGWAAAVFAVHPVTVESAAWITEFKNVLSGTFSLLALQAFLRFRPLSDSDTTATRDWRVYALALLLFLCALLSKTAFCCLPVVLAILLWWKLDRLGKSDILALVPWFALSLTMGLITVRVEDKEPASTAAKSALSVVQRLLLAGRVPWFYAGKIFWPRQFTFVYPRWNIDASAAWQYLFPVAALAVVIALWSWRRRIGKGPLAGVLCFLAMLFPVLGFFDIFYFRYSYVTDHFQYLACIGLIATAVGAAATVVRQAGEEARRLATRTAVIVLLLLGASSWRQEHAYHDLESLWRDTLSKNPDSWLAQNNLGVLLTASGRAPEAVAHNEQAVRLHPDYYESHSNLGLALAHVGRIDEAIQSYQQALQLKPDSAEVHNNLATAYLEAGDPQNAALHYIQGLQIKPDNAEAFINLGNIFLQAGRFPDAIAQYEQALRIKPDSAGAHNNLALALAKAGRIQDAVGHFEEALRIKPDYAEAHSGFGDLLSHAGRFQDAVAHYMLALQLNPNAPAVLNNLAVALSRIGRTANAIQCYERALQLKPDYADAANNLAWLLATAPSTEYGDPARAVTLAESACDLTGHGMPTYLDTLAAAYAVTGRFDDAIATARQAVELARASGQTQLAADIATRIDLYSDKRAYLRPGVAPASPNP